MNRKRQLGDLKTGQRFKAQPHKVSDREVFIVTDCKPWMEPYDGSTVVVSLITGKSKTPSNSMFVHLLDD